MVRTIRAIRDLLVLILSRIPRMKRMTRIWSPHKMHFTIAFGVDTPKPYFENIKKSRNYSGMLIGHPIAILYFLARKITAEGAEERESG